jgi:glycosyltransferase involved in cell wall biosynthesis
VGREPARHHLPAAGDKAVTGRGRAGSRAAAPAHAPAIAPDLGGREIAVLVPCHNEAVAVAEVVRAFAAALPEATIYVYDNASTDETAARARAAGAKVESEPRRGKGNVVRRMFADIDADIYLLVDGDGTYDAAAAPALVARLLEGRFDMVAERRVSDGAAYRPGHRFGNRLLTRLVRYIFGQAVDDMLTGYRAFSRRYVKSFPAASQGFEIETELTVHALQLRMTVAEIPTVYKARPQGSASKLNTVRDGLRILWTIVVLFKEVRPLPFFGLWFALLAAASLILAWPVFLEYFETGLVPRLPTAVAATGAMLLAFLSLTCGLILDSVARGRTEAKRLAYLALPAPGVRRK